MVAAHTHYGAEGLNFKNKFNQLAFCILCFGLAIRLVWIWKDRLWYDEVWSATLAVQPLIDLVIGTLRFDPHPPLYYVQLHFWATFSHSTVWLFANSLFWSCLAIISLFFVAKVLLSERISLVATALFSTMPAAVTQAHSLRMYPMLTCLSVWAWYLTNRCLMAPTRITQIALAAVLLSISYSHATGVFIFIYAGAYGLWLIHEEKLTRSQVVRWLKTNVIVGIISLPAVANSMVRSASSHTISPGLADIFKSLADLSAGGLATTHPASVIGTGLLATGAILFGLRFRQLRPVLVGFVLVPIALGVAISYLVRPIWIDRTLLFTTPFWALAFAKPLMAVAETVRKRSRIMIEVALTSVLCTALATLSILQFDAIPKPTNFEAGAALISSQLQPGDVVYIPDNFQYWGIAWYAIGPDWGSPLSVQGNSSLDCNDRWCGILESLGPWWRQRLHLEPTTRIVWHNNIPFIVGWTIPDQVGHASRVWLITVPGSDYPKAADLKAHVIEEWTDRMGLRIQLLTD